jgi:hypothetical protein
MIDRWLWFLINRKISSLTIASHNIQKDNLDLLSFWTFWMTIMVIIRRLYEKNTWEKSHILNNLADILVQLWYISTTEELFELCNNIVATKDFNIKPTSSQNDIDEKKIEFDARRKLGKYGNILLKWLANPSWEIVPSNILKNYNVVDTTSKQISIKENKPSDRFILALKAFETMHAL